MSDFILVSWTGTDMQQNVPVLLALGSAENAMCVNSIVVHNPDTKSHSLDYSKWVDATEYRYARFLIGAGLTYNLKGPHIVRGAGQKIELEKIVTGPNVEGCQVLSNAGFSQSNIWQASEAKITGNTSQINVFENTSSLSVVVKSIWICNEDTVSQTFEVSRVDVLTRLRIAAYTIPVTIGLSWEVWTGTLVVPPGSRIDIQKLAATTTTDPSAHVTYVEEP